MPYFAGSPLGSMLIMMGQQARSEAARLHRSTQALLGVTRFRVTFIRPGVYHYVCALHDDLGMVGEIIVLP